MPPQIATEALVPNPRLNAFTQFIGLWETGGQHPMVPGVTFHGRVTFDWHEGGAFVIMRTEIDEPEIPSGISIFGSDDDSETLWLIYFDERKVARHYEAALEQQELKWSRTSPKFSQRFSISMGPDGHTMQGVGEMSKDGGPWGADLSLTYTRKG